MKINTDPKKIEEILTRGVEKIYPNPQVLKKKMLSGKRIRLYCGYDPSNPNFHLGHLGTLKKLAQFQSLGHEVIMLVGDFTGMIGDPTDKTVVRRKLSRKEVLFNSRHYKKLASKFLNFGGKNPVKILYNSQWQDKLTFKDLIELASNFTVQQMIVRHMFQDRIKKGKPIYLHEFLYPLAQAYDSCVMDVDLEIGGKDQIFNMLCGRDLMKILKKKEKIVMAIKLLTDPTGEKMGKTRDNMIIINEKPEEMYGKIMAWPDSFLEFAFELLTNVPQKEIKTILKAIKLKSLNPRDLKARLAREIVLTCHNEKSAILAEKEFNRIFQEKKLPSKIPEIEIKEKVLNILDLLIKTKLVFSKAEAKRLILQGGVRIDGRRERNWKKKMEIKKGKIIQIGKRRLVRII